MTAVLPGADFKQAFRRHAAGVVVITADAEHGPVGFTATSLTSLSLDPPLLSFGIARTSSSWQHINIARTIVVNFLTAHQEEVARTFATSGIDRFAGDHWHRLDGGDPVITGSNWLRAETHRLIEIGDHTVVIARVIDSDVSDSSPPLLYHDGSYHTIGQV
ncbi:flavin reductase family protein [Lentzea sp. NPDC058436]|uniref:flavin reductase family protein n=1 Tax=Lentzea sp. NPDC058436 TaxID=3346499 RepID=UPI00364E7B00